MLSRSLVFFRQTASRSLSTSSPISPSLTSSVTSSVPISAAARAAGIAAVRNDWRKDEIQAIYDSPLIDLMYHGASVHRQFHNGREVQQCTLLSIKTGGCTEDCAYCPQSSRYSTDVKASKLMIKQEIVKAATAAKNAGSSRFCMGAAWRDLANRPAAFDQILESVKEVKTMGMEVCCTLGMIEDWQAKKLKEAGLTAYNHNLDTSREYYPKVITTRSYDERLQTLENVRNAGISVCSGGIIGMGEKHEDRVGLLHTLSTLPEHPESVPVNALLAVPGTPLEKQAKVEIFEMVRMIATARIIMPHSTIRLSAGRVKFSIAEQSLCFLAGANSIFTGDKLLTTPNNDKNDDQLMFDLLGLIPKKANLKQGSDKVIAADSATSASSSSCSSSSCSTSKEALA